MQHQLARSPRSRLPGAMSRGSLAVIAALIALGAGTVGPAQASSWSPPVQLPATCGSSVAVNASGAMVAAGFYQSPDLTYHVQVCTSPDGRTWSPANLGVGRDPAVAIAGDGRAVAVWGSITGCPSACSYPLQASVRPPSGSWSTPVTISPDIAVEDGPPVIGVDGSGNAIAAWIEHFGALIHTAALPAGRTWTADTTLSAVTGAHNPDLAVTPGGAVIVSFATGNDAIWAASGTVIGGLAAPVNVAPATYHATAHPRVALNDSGLASLAWAVNTNSRLTTNTKVATRTAGGTWSAPTVLATQDTPADTAIDGTGNAIATFGAFYSWRPAGASWGPATPLPAGAANGRVVADAAGTFVYVDASAHAFTFPAGARPGPGTAVCPASSFTDLKIAPGHAVVLCGTAVSSEPVS